MRFVFSVWLLVLSALLLFTFVVLSHSLFAGDLSPMTVRISVLLSNWVIGLVSAGAITMLYRRAERAIEKAARDETVLEMAGAVAHELNQPLTVIISAAELIDHRDRSPEEVRAVAKRMSDAAQRMADIVAKLQHATNYSSKPYVGDLRIVDLDKAG